MPETLHLLATLRAREGREDELRALLQSLLEPTRAEPGCLRYELLESVNDPREFTFVEEWRTEEDLAAHFETPHLRRARRAYDDLLEGGLDLRRCRRAG